MRDDLPHPSANGEVLVKVRMAGICRTDLELSKGYMGYRGVLGHEFAGEIAGGDAPWPAGTRVVGEINAGCGQCPLCASGMSRHCPNRSVLGILNRDGCMAEWTRLPAENLLRVPDSVSDREAVFTEPLAAALEIFEQVRVEPAHRVCVIGDGKLGLLIAMAFAHKHEGPLALVGRHPDKMRLAGERVEMVTEGSISASMHKQWDIVVEATGNTSGLEHAIRLVKPRGALVLKSTMARPEGIDLSPVVVDEITVVGSRCGRFEPALRLLERKAVPAERLIEAEFPLERAMEAWELAQTRGSKKVLLTMAG